MDASSGKHKKAEGATLAAIVANEALKKEEEKKCEDEQDHGTHKDDGVKSLAITEEVVHNQQADKEENTDKSEMETK